MHSFTRSRGSCIRQCPAPCPTPAAAPAIPPAGTLMPVAYSPGIDYQPTAAQANNVWQTLALFVTGDVQAGVTVKLEYWHNQCPYEDALRDGGVTTANLTLTAPLAANDIVELVTSTTGTALQKRSTRAIVSAAGEALTGPGFRFLASLQVSAFVSTELGGLGDVASSTVTQSRIGWRYLSDAEAAGALIGDSDNFNPTPAPLLNAPNKAVDGLDVTFDTSGNEVAGTGLTGYTIATNFNPRVPVDGSPYLDYPDTAALSPNFPVNPAPLRLRPQSDYTIVLPVGRPQRPFVDSEDAPTVEAGVVLDRVPATPAANSIVVPMPGAYFFRFPFTVAKGSWGAARDAIAQPDTPVSTVGVTGVVTSPNKWQPYGPASLFWTDPANAVANVPSDPTDRYLQVGTDGNIGITTFIPAAGQIAPVSFQPSGPDGGGAAAAFVVLLAIPPNTSFVFTTQAYSAVVRSFGATSFDLETGATSFTSTVPAFTWVSPATTVPAGAVVAFQNIGQGAAAPITVTDAHGTMGGAAGSIGAVVDVDPDLEASTPIHSLTVLGTWLSLDASASPITDNIVTMMLSDAYSGDIPPTLTPGLTMPYWRFPATYVGTFAPGQVVPNGAPGSALGAGGTPCRVLPATAMAGIVNGAEELWGFGPSAAEWLTTPARLPSFELGQWREPGFYGPGPFRLDAAARIGL